ncbi:transcriptional regulator (plasmid) [Deinococcus wulumuqiensis]|uniref:Transcriptional regulator n=1 Tax=Deinococcus wulumuqiensis TaxID=980427 RepID=A0A345IL95_9DEIO|nr:XRE family transcriptional regulator [Deinococcus wulumuqiensis]AXH00468.1 transcriptional regulator [Deinococcus wulumuqiensis]
MAKKWSDLKAQMSPERQARIDARTEALQLEMDLAELRKTRDLTQSDVAQVLEKEQAAISKIEGREDMFLSTLREYVRALGGELKLIASFPDAEIQIHPSRR